MYHPSSRSALALAALATAFLTLSAAFVLDWWGRISPLPPIPLVAPSYTNTSTVRISGAELVRTGEDASGLDCYACHDRDKPVILSFDDNQNVIVAPEHEDIVLNHGRHHRNNNCFNCHNEANLELLQTRDGRDIKLLESSPLCGSCHGPTYRDWEAGAHGRTSGYWDASAGASRREDCVSCHDPHAPGFPVQAPAPPPRPLRHRSGTQETTTNDQ
jgi:hypothetical protein